MLGMMGAGAVVVGALFLAREGMRRSRMRWAALSPFVILAVPLAVVMIVQMYSVALYDLDEINLLYCVFNALHLLLIWFICFIFEGSVSDRHPKCRAMRIVDYDEMLPMMRALGVCVSVIQIVSFFSHAGAVSVIGNVVQEDFQNEYAGGVNFYLRLVSMICAAYFLSGLNKNRISNLALGAICLVPVFLTFVKGVVIISLVAGLIGNIIVNERAISAKAIILVAVLGVSVFFGVYLVEICIWNIDKLFKPETYEYIFAKMNFYLISGPQSFNIRVSSPQEMAEFARLSDGNIVLAPLMNILNWFGFDSRIDTTSNVFTLIGNIPNYGVASGNVYTYIGELVLQCGLFGSMVAEAILCSIVCFFYTRFQVTGKTTSLLAYLLLGTFFFLSWFDSYFTQTFWVYSLFIIGAISVAFNLLGASKGQVRPKRRWGARRVR